MADVLDRVQRLIQLAAGCANEHEARNAAVKACQIIKEHNLILSMPHSRNSHPWRGESSTRMSPEHFTQIMDDLFGGAGSAAWSTRHHQRASSVRDEVNAQRRTEASSRRKRSEVVKHPSGALLLRAKVGGQCKECGSRFDAGELVWWKDSRGCVHQMCDPYVL